MDRPAYTGERGIGDNRVQASGHSGIEPADGDNGVLTVDGDEPAVRPARARYRRWIA